MRWPVLVLRSGGRASLSLWRASIAQVRNGSCGALVRLAGLGVPGVNVILGGVGEVVVALVEPVQEVLGVGELLAGEPSGGCGERAGAGSRAQPWELVPAAELGQQPMVRVVDVALVSLRVGVSQYDHRRWQPR